MILTIRKFLMVDNNGGNSYIPCDDSRNTLVMAALASSCSCAAFLYLEVTWKVTLYLKWTKRANDSF